MANINFSSLKSFGGTAIEKKFNALVDLVQSIQLKKHPSYRLNRTVNGTYIVPYSNPGDSTTCPFTVKLISDGEGGLNASVSAGTVNHLLPSNNFSTFSVSASDVVQVKITARTDGTAVTSCVLALDTDNPAVQEPTPFALPASVEILIAVIVNGIPYRVLGCGSIQLTGQVQFITNQDPPAEPGTLNYTPYYIWAVGTI